MSETPTRKEFDDLAAGHALGALSASDAARLAALRLAHPEWEHVVAEDVETAARIADTARPVEPPIGVRSALLSAIAESPQDPPGDEEAATHTAHARAADPPARAERSPSRRWFGLAAVIALLAVLSVAGIWGVTTLTRPASVVALEEITAAPDSAHAKVALPGGGSAEAFWSGDLGRAVLVTEELPPLGDGEVYELWYVRGDTPVSAGTFDAATGTTALTGEFSTGDVIAVTVEADGGSPTGSPTTDPLFAIETS